MLLISINQQGNKYTKKKDILYKNAPDSTRFFVPS